MNSQRNNGTWRVEWLWIRIEAVSGHRARWRSATGRPRVVVLAWTAKPPVHMPWMSARFCSLSFFFLFINQLLPLLCLFHCVVHYEPLQRAGRENNWRVSRKGFHISTQSSQDVKMDRDRERERERVLRVLLVRVLHPSKRESPLVRARVSLVHHTRSITRSI